MHVYFNVELQLLCMVWYQACSRYIQCIDIRLKNKTVVVLVTLLGRPKSTGCLQMHPKSRTAIFLNSIRRTRRSSPASRPQALSTEVSVGEAARSVHASLYCIVLAVHAIVLFHSTVICTIYECHTKPALFNEIVLVCVATLRVLINSDKYLLAYWQVKLIVPIV